MHMLHRVNDAPKIRTPPNPYSQAILRLVPGVGPIAAQLRNELFDRDQKRYEEFRAALEDDMALDDLARLLRQNERFADMLRDAVEAAVRTRDESKIRLLARSFVLGTLAEDDAAIDEAELQTRLIAELDPVDLRAVLALRDKAFQYGHPVGCLTHELSISDATANLIYARLRRSGLVETEPIATIDPADAAGEVELNESWGLTTTAHAIMRLMDSLRDGELK